ncbi:MAG: FIST N-terminal domain-containing protein [Candidatus Poribacteria bacterium]|nr:FIST C-terminal domain-containing protein [Candidatus Poribacteria bacterium]MDP6583989.1 FIST N-terminal domain-containing protein [Anaerolineales bacterium]MEC7868425.1 FIST N-terminal domain-containing protein [Candidatus Poribacteria bacterium]
MIRAGVGYSHNLSTAEATEQAVTMAMSNAKIAKSDLVFVFATVNYASEYQQIFEGIKDISGSDCLVGCSGMSVLTSAGEFEGQSTIAVLVVRSDQLSIHPLLETKNDIASISTIIDSHVSAKDNSLLTIFPDIRSDLPTQLIQKTEEYQFNVPIVGAAASGNPTTGQAHQWCGEKMVETSTSGALLTGSFHTEVGVAQGCQPFGKAAEITRADGDKILELNEIPALEVLQKSLELLTEEDIRRSGGMVFLGMAMDNSNQSPEIGDYLIRNIMGIDRDSSAIESAEHITEGQIVRFHLRTPYAARQEIQTIIDRMSQKTQQHPPAFGLYFNCLGRGTGLYGEKNYDIGIIKAKFPDLPIIGFFGNAEYAPIGNRNFMHAYTGAFVTCSEE